MPTVTRQRAPSPPETPMPPTPGDPAHPPGQTPLGEIDFQYTLPARPPVKGRIVIDLASIATSRGAIVRHGPFRGRPNLTTLMRGTGLSQTTIFPLLRDPDSVRGIQMETLARICEFLKCQPGDLMRYEEAPETPSTGLSDAYKKGNL